MPINSNASTISLHVLNIIDMEETLMKIGLIVALATTVLFAGSFVTETWAEKKVSCTKSLLKDKKPSSADKKKAITRSKGKLNLSEKGMFDCWSFCDEVCMIQPGGVCYCGAQSYDCGGEPVSY